MKFKIGLLIFSFLILSCEKKTNWKINSSDTDYIIVDGILTNEFIEHTVKLDHSVPDQNISPKPVSGAYVIVSSSGDTVLFLEDFEKPGVYCATQAFSAVINRNYKLDIFIEDDHYFAFANILPVTANSPLSYTQANDTGLYYINLGSGTAGFNTEEAAMFEIKIDWAHVPGYESLPEDSTSAIQYYYYLKTLDVNQLFSPPHETVYFPLGSKILQKKYSLTPDHERFIRSLLIETTWNGGFFDIEEGNVYTNLSKGALGFFGACSVISDSLIVE